MTEKPKPRKKRKKSARGGRPAWKPTIEDRQTIEQMKFCGEAEAVIARALGIDVDTLRKHCKDELASGHANRRKEIIGLLFESARAKNASSIKKLEEMGRIAGAAEALEARGNPDPKQAPLKEPKLGKKEQRQQAAERVGGIFTPPEPPKLVVNNGT